MPIIGTRRNPKGPSLSRSERHRLDLSGTTVLFEAPEHDDSLVPDQTELDLSVNIYDPERFSRYNEDDAAEPPSRGLAVKWWNYTGIPILDGTGYLGRMEFRVGVSRMPEFTNLFRPRNFENAVERFIYTSPSSTKDPGTNRLDWQVVDINGTRWVNYEMIGYTALYSAEEVYTLFWQTPITGEHMLTVEFVQVIALKRTRLKEAFQGTIKSIMNSFTIELSSDAATQKADAERQWPDEHISGSLPPYEFESVELKDVYELTTIASQKFDHDPSVPFETIDKMVKEMDREQRARAEAVRKKVLRSHLR